MTWEQVTSNPKWVNADPIKRLKIRERYLANVVVPYAKQHGMDETAYAREWLDKTYDSVGFPRYRGEEPLKIKQSGLERVLGGEKEGAVIDDFVRGYVNEFTLRAFSPILYAGVDRTKQTTGEKISEGIGALGGFVGAGVAGGAQKVAFGGAGKAAMKGSAPAARIMDLVGGEAGKLIAKTFGKEAAEKQLTRFIVHSGQGAAGLGAAMAMMQPEDAEPTLKSIMKASVGDFDGLQYDVKERAKQLAGGAAMGAAFGTLGFVPNRAARVAAGAAIGGGIPTIEGGDVADVTLGAGIGALAGGGSEPYKGKKTVADVVRGAAGEPRESSGTTTITVDGQTIVRKGGEKPALQVAPDAFAEAFPKNREPLNIPQMNEEARRQAHRETLPPPLEVDIATPTSRKLEPITPVQRATGAPSNIEMLPSTVPKTVADIVRERQVIEQSEEAPIAETPQTVADIIRSTQKPIETPATPSESVGRKVSPATAKEAPKPAETPPAPSVAPPERAPSEPVSPPRVLDKVAKEKISEAFPISYEMDGKERSVVQARRREAEDTYRQTGELPKPPTPSVAPPPDPAQSAKGVEVPKRLGSEAYIESRKNPAGHWQLFYKGTRNEVFPNEKFRSGQEARQYFKAMKAKQEQAPPPAPAAPKEAWQMTREEFKSNTDVLPLEGVVNKGGFKLLTKNTLSPDDNWNVASTAPTPSEAIKYRHRSVVETALREGKPVPPEALADYPDLKPSNTTPVGKPSPDRAAIEREIEDLRGVMQTGTANEVREAAARKNALQAQLKADGGFVFTPSKEWADRVKQYLMQDTNVDAAMKYGYTPPRGMNEQQLRESAMRLGKDPAEIEAYIAQRPQVTPDMNQRAEAVDMAWAQNDANLQARAEANKTKVWSSIRKHLDDASYDTKKALEGMGLEGKKAVREMELMAGWSNIARTDIKPFQDAFSNLSREDALDYEHYSAARNLAQVYERKLADGVEYKLPNEMKYEDLTAWLKTREQAWGADRFAKINEVMQVKRNLVAKELAKMLEEGLITEESYNSMLKNYDYNPIRFIQYLDDDVVQFRDGRKITTTKSGINRIEEGSYESILTDPQELMRQMVARTNARIAANRADKALLAVADAQGEDGLVRRRKFIPKRTPDGEPSAVMEDVPPGWSEISAMVGGQRQEMLMRNDIAEGWGTDPVMDRQVAGIFTWLSGKPILTAFATGINPAFAFVNVPRDVGHLFMTGAPSGYSGFFPKFLAQYAGDVKDVFSDTIKRKGRYNDYVNEGGGMELMTHQGQTNRSQLGIETNAKLTAVRDFLSYINETSELMTRLAQRERGIKSGLDQREATYQSRKRIDYSISGKTGKALNTFIPYFNAAIQATKGITRAARQDPKLFAWKVAQLGALSTALYAYNKGANPEAFDQESESKKAANWVITTPNFVIDERGQKRYINLMIPKDQSIQVITSLFDLIASFKMNGKPPTEEIRRAVLNALPVEPLSYLTPTLQAYLGYALNRDTYYMKDIWANRAYPVGSIKPEAEFYESTPAFYKNVAGGLGLSPVRSQYAVEKLLTNNNPYTDVLGIGYKYLTSEVSDKQQSDFSKSMLNKYPVVKRFVSYTNPRNAQEVEELGKRSIEENTRRLEQNRVIDTPAMDRKTAMKYINEQPREDRQRLYDRYDRVSANRGVPTFYLNLADEAPIVRAAAYYDKWVKLSLEEQKSMDTTTRRIKGFWSEQFVSALNNLKRGTK